jgi:hypothetical protein
LAKEPLKEGMLPADRTPPRIQMEMKRHPIVLIGAGLIPRDADLPAYRTWAYILAVIHRLEERICGARHQFYITGLREVAM